MEASDDLSTCNQSISNLLKLRFQQNRQYAKSGGTALISTTLEIQQQSKEYQQNSMSYLENAQIPKLPPHIHQLTTEAFLQMVTQKQDQTILIHGIDGSGKSINRLSISKQLVLLANNGKKKSKVLSGAAKMELALEAFGSYKSPLSAYASEEDAPYDEASSTSWHSTQTLSCTSSSVS